MLFLGDIHGAFFDLERKIENEKIVNDTIIQLGDTGVGFYHMTEMTLTRLGEKLFERGLTMYMIRGNHDNPNYFQGLANYGKGLFLVPDYTYLKIENKLLLLIGGGISLDRTMRVQGQTYWLNEPIQKHKILNKNVDILVTHVPLPNKFNNPEGEGIVNHWKQYDRDLKIDLEKEHKVLNYLDETVHFKKWIAGHYHKNDIVETDKACYQIVDTLNFVKG